MAVPCSLAKGKLIDTNDGVVDTWEWFKDSINGICGGGDIEVTHNGTKITISYTAPEREDDDDEDTTPETPPPPPLDTTGMFNAGMNLIPGDDTNIVFTTVSDEEDPNYGKTKVNVYYK